MFERYTESARRALFFARYEVSQLGAVSIEAEHLLLGVTREAKGIVAQILSEAEVAGDDIRRDVETQSRFREKISTSVEIPFAESAHRALHFAAEEADQLKHGYIGPEHLLLGILRDKDSPAAAILHRRGLRLDGVRAAVARHAAEPTPDRAAFSDVSAEIDRLKDAIDKLAAMSADSVEGDVLAARIRERLETLKRYFAP